MLPFIVTFELTCFYVRAITAPVLSRWTQLKLAVEIREQGTGNREQGTGNSKDLRLVYIT